MRAVVRALRESAVTTAKGTVRRVRRGVEEGGPNAGRVPREVRAAVAGRAARWSAGLLAVLVAVVVVSTGIGPVSIPPQEVTKVLANAIAVPIGVEVGPRISAGPIGVPAAELRWYSPFSFPVEGTHEAIVRRVRLPRVVLAALVGFALAAAGTVMQGFFRNPMADPSIIGVSSGAAVGATVFIIFPAALSGSVGPVAVSVPHSVGLSLLAFVGALLAAFTVYLIATRNGRTPVATLLLAGIAVQTFLGSVISYLQLRAGESLQEVVAWLMGDLSGSGRTEVLLVAALVVPLFVVLLAYARDLNVMLLGEQEARGLGIEVERTKRVLLAVSSLITAAGVAVAGIIGFVGLIVPHMLRLVVGPDHRILLPTAALAGASFLVVADTVARTGPLAVVTGATGTEIPVGIVTAAVGAPFFVYLLRKREVHEL